MKKIAFIGGGSFGTALSMVLGDKGYEITVYDRKEEVVEEINKSSKNSLYLKDCVLPENVKATLKIEEALKGAEMVVIAVPSHAVRDVCKMMSKHIPSNTIITSVAKGIEQGTLKRMSQIIEEEIPQCIPVILSGPSHAEEVALKMPTTLVAASKNREAALTVQDEFMTPNLRVYTNDDIIGVEVGGAVKNIIAFSAGVLDGIGYGDNAKAALMTRGMSEIVRAGEKLGGKQETFYGLTGMGDLIVTCTSMHSRNRRAGILLAKGYSEKEACKEIGMVVEGIKACRAFHELSEKMNVSMPITNCLYRVLQGELKPEEATKELMTREKKSEF
ncbi:NAD(P)H-dependent glycerol-3-phosphate dehydrogenase [Oceanirhabdus sp. W0125-5]|uniref:NAD(P)H-dependent glycerol-3-phosphate dehydrogenase n=1 Tax=Oceanirhabdus sp. W0125-5 TaxID=2999116 RepID=UPI0022F2D641|nr:NAD(P)H-dependent glycerol-3-phosphate dehydrogenase [Oceanirhabdus sp. W0125-5]WBW99638.1 NAD(P)H-dependent glycerol-3-phosphate dehydrogenase [Oceanirhabdus sp. W0125-5]